MEYVGRRNARQWAYLLELPKIIGEMLKYYYYIGENQASYSPLSKALNYVIENDEYYIKLNLQARFKGNISVEDE